MTSATALPKPAAVIAAPPFAAAIAIGIIAGAIKINLQKLFLYLKITL